MKKILALVLATLMLVAMMVPAIAEDDPAFDTPLTVSGLVAGDVANFYKIVEWVGDATQPAGSVVVSGWKVLSPFDTVLTENVFKDAFVGTPEVAAKDAVTDNSGNVITPAVAHADAVPPTGITSEIAGHLARLENKGTATEVMVDENETSAVLNNTAPGMWMALITPADPDTIYNPVFVGSDYNTSDSGDINASTATYAADAVAKKSTVTLTKTANTTEDPWDNPDATNEYHWSTTAIGDTVNYTVTTTIPGYGKIYQNPTFIVRDQLNNLTLKKNASDEYIIAVTGVAATFTPAGGSEKASYTIDPTDTGYTITFDKDFLKTIITPTAITITYDAVVASTAPYSVNKEKNEVSTEFSHNPSKESDHGFKKDTTNHYTFTLDADILGGGSKEAGYKTSELIKIGVQADGTPITSQTVTMSDKVTTDQWYGPLEGAVFGLFTDAAGSTAYVPNGASTGLTATTGPDGRMKFEGLDAGTYYLKEIDAPAGYVKDTTVYMISIHAKTKEVTLTEYTTNGTDWITKEAYDALGADAKKDYKGYTYKTDVLDTYTVKVGTDADHLEETATYHFENNYNDVEVKWTEYPPVEHPFDINNTKGVELPSTGGMGTTLLYIGGSVLVILAAVLLITKRRMSAND